MASKVETIDPSILAARAKLFAKKGGDNARTGGKGTVRRKVKAKHAPAAVDDKKLQSQLKKLGLNQIPDIEEVNMFQKVGNVLHFQNPKVQFCFPNIGDKNDNV